MTEEGWLTGTDPTEMLAFLRSRCPFSVRKATLLMAAACRLLPGLMANEGSLLAVGAAEEVADGGKAPARPGNWRALFAELAEGVTPSSTDRLLGSLTRWPEDLVPLPETVTARRAGQSDLLRDVFGNPFRPPPVLATSLLGWHDGLVVRLAQAAYKGLLLPSGHLDPARLSVLADALEEAGCGDHEVLTHLREQGKVHVRGCFVVDLLLGKS
jgi:hypothetical protein